MVYKIFDNKLNELFAGVLTSSNPSNANVTNGSHSNNALTITPKIEPSQPEHYERQTVLMWGASNHGNASNRSPATTPTSNGLYANENNHLKLSNQILSPANEHTHHVATQSNAHLKWSENQSGKEIPVSAGIYSIHSHQSETASVADASSMYAHVAHSPHLTNHSSTSATATGHILSPEHNSNTTQNHHQHHANNVTQQTIGSSCEVWSPAYSQYQYFTYHHAPQHANTQ